MRRKKEGLLARTREMMGTGIPKRRKKGGCLTGSTRNVY
jgi:hypothetical protein